MVIVLSAEAETRLKEEAMRRGVPPDQLAEQHIREATTKPRAGRATLALLEQWEREDAAETRGRSPGGERNLTSLSEI